MVRYLMECLQIIMFCEVPLVSHPTYIDYKLVQERLMLIRHQCTLCTSLQFLYNAIKLNHYQNRLIQNRCLMYYMINYGRINNLLVLGLVLK